MKNLYKILFLTINLLLPAVLFAASNCNSSQQICNPISATDFPSLLKLPEKPAQLKLTTHTYAGSKKPARVRDFGLAHTTESVKSFRASGPASSRTLLVKQQREEG